MTEQTAEPASRPLVLVQGARLADRIAGWCGSYTLAPFDPADAHVPDPDLAREAEVLVWDGTPLDAAALDRLPRLRLVAGLATGYGGVDLAMLRARGIILTNGAGVNAHDVADHALALLLGLWHRLVDYDRAARAGETLAAVGLRSSLRGRKVGVVGLGRIGRAIVARLAPHEVDIQWWGPRPKPDVATPRADNLIELAEWADILIVASRDIEANRRQIDGDVLDALGADGMLLNISRGRLIDEDALIARLRDGRLGGAALDVFVDEPVIPERWVGVPNILLTPHVAGATREAVQALYGQLRENVDLYWAGAALLTPVEDEA